MIRGSARSDRATGRRAVRLQIPQDQDVDENRRRGGGWMSGHGRGLRAHSTVGKAGGTRSGGREEETLRAFDLYGIVVDSGWVDA